MQPEISKYFRKNSGPSDKEKDHGSKNDRRLSPEKAKLKHRLKLVGEETRKAYAACEDHNPRVTAAYSKTHLTTRNTRIPVHSHRHKTLVSVIDSDTLDAVMRLNAAGASGSIGVLNMASEKHVGGGFLSGAPAQEESLCRRTTLYPCLQSVRDTCYPIPPTGILISPDVLVFRMGLEEDFKIMPWEECLFVTMISVAAIRRPPVKNGRFEMPGHKQLTTTKVRELLRAAFHAGCSTLVLGALGCGAFKNPPYEVAEIFYSVLNEDEFRSAFQRIVFAIIDSENASYGKTTNNFEIFHQCFNHATDSHLSEAVGKSNSAY